MVHPPIPPLFSHELFAYDWGKPGASAVGTSMFSIAWRHEIRTCAAIHSVGNCNRKSQ